MEILECEICEQIMTPNSGCACAERDYIYGVTYTLVDRGEEE